VTAIVNCNHATLAKSVFTCHPRDVILSIAKDPLALPVCSGALGNPFDAVGILVRTPRRVIASRNCAGILRYAQDDENWGRGNYIQFLMDCPANRISAPQCSAKSAHLGFLDSISAIFFARVQPFSSFSRPIAR